MVWTPLDPGPDYRASFTGAAAAVAELAKVSGVHYSTHWPLVVRSDSAGPRVMVVGKAANGWARLDPSDVPSSVEYARSAGTAFDPFPGGSYHGGFWKFLVGPNGVFSRAELDGLRLAWTNLFKVGRGYNVDAAGAPSSGCAPRPSSVVYTGTQPSADGRPDNNPTRRERTAQGRETMCALLRQEVEAFEPDIILCLGRSWLDEVAAPVMRSPVLPANEHFSLTVDQDFVGTGRAALVGRHPIRVHGGFPAYARQVRAELEAQGWVVEGHTHDHRRSRDSSAGSTTGH